jgi:hypothetical protein
LGFDADAYRCEREPAQQVQIAAEIDAAERLRAEQAEEQAVRIIAALGRSL